MTKHQNLSLSHIVAQGKEYIVSDMDQEKVMLSIRNGKYYNLGQIGGRIWDIIELPTPITQLITTLVSEYDVEQSKCELQVIAFLESLLAEGIIHICEDGKA